MTIEEMALNAYPPTPDPRSDCDDGWDYNEQYRDCYIEGAKAVLEEIENFMKGLDLGNSAEEKFYKLDVLADIHGFIQKLKEK